MGSVENIGNGRWVIRGRACEDISIGDILTDDLKTNDGLVNLRVLSISSYGREIDVLYKMMTGDLVIVSEKIDELKYTENLYKI